MNQEGEKSNNLLDSEIDFREIVLLIWEKKIFLSISSFIITIFFIIYSLTIPNQYTSKSILEIQNNSETSSTLSSLKNQFGGLASLAGINFGSAESGDKSFWVIERIKSKEFSRHLYSFEGVLENLLAIKTYDYKSNVITYDTKIFNKGNWLTNKKGTSYKPTYLEFHEAFNSVLSVKKDTETNFIILKVQHLSPYFAKEFLSLIIREINLITKNNDKKEADYSLKYLQSVLRNTSVKDTRDSINELIKSQLNIIMLADIKDFYILRPIDSPFIPEQKSSPSRSTIAIMGLFLGGFLSFLFVLIRHYRRKD